MSTAALDMEVIRHRIGSIADEMALTMIRTAYSGIVRDTLDFSTAICDASGEMVAQGFSLPLHLGSIPDAMSAVRAAFTRPRRGDIYAMNDPYSGGMHLPDIFVFKPVFRNADLLGYLCVVAHHADIGGRMPGGGAADSTEIYQEGLCLPPVRLCRRERPDPNLHAIIARNVRVPEKVLGDLQAQVTACRVAEKALLEAAEDLGIETLRGYFAQMLAYSERLARAEIRAMPDGEYRFLDHIDDDGLDDQPVPIAVRITIVGDTIEVDFSGSAAQVRGAINATASFTRSAVYAALRYLMSADIPNNAGYFRPIQVVVPSGSVLNPRHPAAVGARGVVGYRVAEAVFGAMAQALPDRVFAAGEGGISGVRIGGRDERLGTYLMVDAVCGAWGARPDRDGIDGVANFAANVANTPCEVIEAEYPVRIERYGLQPDSGGIGRFRGGLGVVREWRFLGEAGVLTVRSDRRRFRPYGLQGGGPGGPSTTLLDPDGSATLMPTKFTRQLARGDVVRHVQAGGGGFGDPLERDPGRVAHDARAGKVSLVQARDAYGVALNAKGNVDEPATKSLRSARHSPKGTPSAAAFTTAADDSRPLDENRSGHTGRQEQDEEEEWR